MSKFKKGDTIGAITKGRGLSEALIQRVDEKYYYCKVVNGTAMIPIVAEENYQKVPKVWLK
jgi:hypothetical protein